MSMRWRRRWRRRRRWRGPWHQAAQVRRVVGPKRRQPAGQFGMRGRCRVVCREQRLLGQGNAPCDDLIGRQGRDRRLSGRAGRPGRCWGRRCVCRPGLCCRGRSTTRRRCLLLARPAARRKCDGRDAEQSQDAAAAHQRRGRQRRFGHPAHSSQRQIGDAATAYGGAIAATLDQAPQLRTALAVHLRQQLCSA